MTGASREKDQADFDLDAFIDLFDEALTSSDPSVQQTLQHLMVIAALARNHAKHDRRNGPLRRLFENQNDIIRRLERLEVGNATFKQGYGPIPTPMPSTPTGPTIWPQVYPNTITSPGQGAWPPLPGTYPPGTIWSTGATGVADNMASSTSYAYDPPTTSIAERIDSLLKDPSYKGSSVGANADDPITR